MLVPVLLSLFGSNYTSPNDEHDVDDDDDSTIIDKNVLSALRSSSKSGTKNPIRYGQSYSKSSRAEGSRHKNRCYVRVQSNISLSTISEESQSRMQSPELKIEISSMRR